MTCGQGLLWKRTGPFLLTNAGCRCCSFQGISSICWAYFSDGMVSPGFKAVVDQTTSRPPNSDNDLFWCKSGFGKYFGASSWSNHWASHCWLSYKIHFSSHDTIWLRNGSLLLSRIRGHFKWQFFKNFQSVHKAPTYQAFPPFQFASNTKWL